MVGFAPGNVAEICSRTRQDPHLRGYPPSAVTAPAVVAPLVYRTENTQAGMALGGYATLLAVSSRDCHSDSLSLNSAAATFSSRCFTREVPGIGSMTGERQSSHATATCEVVAL